MEKYKMDEELLEVGKVFTNMCFENISDVDFRNCTFLNCKFKGSFKRNVFSNCIFFKSQFNITVSYNNDIYDCTVRG